MKQMRIHIWAFLVCVALLFAVLPTSVGAAELASGICGSGITWSLDNQGTLTISGTGAMYDAPWRDEHSAVVKKVVIQQGVTNIDDWAFYNCSNLSSISIPNSVTSIGELAFDGCSSLRSISIPDSVTSIGKWAFMDCASLRSITIPKGITSIDTYTFGDCINLESVVIPDSVISIGDNAFSHCEKLKTVKIPDGVINIGSYAFHYCSSLTSIVVPDGITNIGSCTFFGCSNLTWIQLPDSISNIDSLAFSNCTNLTDIYYVGTSNQWNALSNRPKADYVHIGYRYSPDHWETESKTGSCTEAGYRKAVCKCGYERLDYYTEAPGHDWINATCTTPKVCRVCETTSGDPLGHSWVDATCVAPKTCKICGATKGNILGHSWLDATCTKPKRCKDCEATEGEPLGHDWKKADCENPKTCENCGETSGSALGHDLGDWQIITKPTATVSGKAKRECERKGCDYSESKNLGKQPEKPELTVSGDKASGKPSLKWSEVTDGAKYEIYRKTGKDGTYKKIATVTKTRYTDKSASVGVLYYYRIRAVTETGVTSGYSSGRARTCDLPKPVVTESNVSSSGKIKLVWKKIEGAVKYKIYRRVGKSGDYAYYTSTTSTSYTDKNTKAGTVYYYQVKACHTNASADSAKSAVGQTCDLAQPVVKETNVSSSGKVKLEWNKISGAVKYKIYRRVGKSGDYEYLTSTTGTSYTDKTAKAGTVYYYKVKAAHSNSNADSAKSSAVGQTCHLARPDVSIKLSSGNPKLSWEKISGAKEYKVYRATSRDGTYKAVKTTTSVSFTDKEAKAGKTYYYKVKAIHSNSSANSAYSSVDYIKAK